MSNKSAGIIAAIPEAPESTLRIVPAPAKDADAPVTVLRADRNVPGFRLPPRPAVWVDPPRPERTEEAVEAAARPRPARFPLGPQERRRADLEADLAAICAGRSGGGRG